MKHELRINNNGTRYYSFVYYDTNLKRPIRIPKQTIQDRFGADIVDLKKAQEALKILVAEMNTLESRKKKMLRWVDEYYKFTELLEFYEEVQKKKAPNSWKNNIHYLKYYVLHYFLNIKKCNNLSSWFDYYEEYRVWLEEDATLVKQAGKRISYASKNHAIRALNTFMTHLHHKGVIAKIQTCLNFPAHTLNEKGFEEVISLEEMEKVYNHLKSSGYHLEATYYRFLYFTGLRFNEALGIHPGNIFEGPVDDQVFSKQLTQENINYLGHIVFDSQPDHATRGLRSDDGTVKRKPLKGRHKIDNKSGRSVVITDKILWNELVQLHNVVGEKRERLLYGNLWENYPIFEGLDKTTATKRLKNAYAACGLSYRNWHACRHTRATELIGQTGNTFLARLWLGHSSEKVLKRYVHVYEAVIRNLKKKSYSSDSAFVKLKKID